MSTLTRIILVFTTALVPAMAFSAERKGKAVYETSPEQGMRLSETALKNIEVKTAKISGGPKLTVPMDALVHFQDQIGIYRLRQGWFKLITVKVDKKSKTEAIVISEEFNSSDEIAIHGADLLRVSEIDAFESGE